MSINNLQHVDDYGKHEHLEVNEHQATERGELAAVSASSQPAATTPRPSGARSAMGPSTGSDGGMEPGADSTQTQGMVGLFSGRGMTVWPDQQSADNSWRHRSVMERIARSPFMFWRD